MKFGDIVKKSLEKRFKLEDEKLNERFDDLLGNAKHSVDNLLEEFEIYLPIFKSELVGLNVKAELELIRKALGKM